MGERTRVCVCEREKERENETGEKEREREKVRERKRERREIRREGELFFREKPQKMQFSVTEEAHVIRDTMTKDQTKKTGLFFFLFFCSFFRLVENIKPLGLQQQTKYFAQLAKLYVSRGN